MSRNVYAKSIRRTIFGSLGRYIAILAIIALGVGFFAGIKDTKASMMLTCDKYVNEHNMYDLRLLSTYGFTEEDAEAISAVDGVSRAEGAISADFFSVDKAGNSLTVRAHSLTDGINDLELLSGRMPESDGECVGDSHFFGEGDIGSVVAVTGENDKETRDSFAHGGYKLVGVVNSPYYIMKTERGTTSLGDGKIDAYIYMPEGGLVSEYFTEMLVRLDDRGFVFSDEYDKNVKKAEGPVTAAAEKRAAMRYDDIVADAEKEINDGQKEIDDGRAELAREKTSAYAKLSDAKAKLESSEKELAAQKNDLSKQRAELEGNRREVQAGIAETDKALEAAMAYPEENAELIRELNMKKAGLENSLGQINGGLARIDDGEKQIAEAEEQIRLGYEDYNSGMAEAKSEFASAEAELSDGEKELEEARDDLASLEPPEIYVQKREDNTGYESFESNADIVESIAKIFPVFFFLIAALVCSTTMSRMIEEERTQIGAFRAIGYTSGRIMMKYMIYSGSAAVIGCVLGFFAGSKYFPYFIWIAYGMMYGFAPLEFYFDWPLAVISLVVSLICSMGTTYIACRGQLRHMPAEILRPKAPKAGKRIFLERVGFVWNRMKFLHKVTARNIFRYKKRMIMMILGIGGCTALVLAGFGINDSIAGIADHQYTHIEKYHMAAAFTDTIDEETKTEFEQEYGGDIDNIAVLQQTSVNAKSDGVTKSCSLMVTDDEKINRAVNFAADGKALPYPNRGEAMINNKLAEMLGLRTGDEIELNYDDTENVSLRISGIYDNYVSNYVYINSETYESDMGKAYEPSIMFVTLRDGVDEYDMAERINGFDGIAGLSVNEDIRNRVDDMMVSLNYIIILVIGCAGALAFIVLFNLGNINITEREREIATIEVLGFFPREMGSYVFRENFILSLMGIVIGLPAGYFLHKFIMSRIVVDMVAFNDVVEPLSYCFTVAVVIGFSIIVDIILRRKLKRINMAEALKSIE